MDGMRFVYTVHLHGTLAADASFRFALPCPATLVHVSAVASNNSDATLKLGTTSDDDGYKTASTIGDSGVPVVWERGDFDGALVTAGECPHLDAGTVVLGTLDHDGSAGTAGANVTIALTFLEG